MTTLGVMCVVAYVLFQDVLLIWLWDAYVLAHVIVKWSCFISYMKDWTTLVMEKNKCIALIIAFRSNKKHTSHPICDALEFISPLLLCNGLQVLGWNLKWFHVWLKESARVNWRLLMLSKRIINTVGFYSVEVKIHSIILPKTTCGPKCHLGAPSSSSKMGRWCFKLSRLSGAHPQLRDFQVQLGA